jgi:hypothetical protein
MLDVAEFARIPGRTGILANSATAIRADRNSGEFRYRNPGGPEFLRIPLPQSEFRYLDPGVMKH